MAQIDAGAYGSGKLYSDPNVINQVRASGLTTIVAWSVHVQENGDINFNDTPIIVGGRYVGDPGWPERMVSLKKAPTSVRRLIFSVGAGGTQDFTHIQQLIKKYGTGTDSILYRNFRVLKAAIPAIDAIDFDDEDLQDEDTTVKFATMLNGFGWSVTFCPYNNNEFWINCLVKLNTAKPGLVSGFNLQCYDGGGSNTPGEWIEEIEKRMRPPFDAKTFVSPGLWARHGSACDEGECPAEIRARLASWKSSGIDSGWIWMLDEVLACEGTSTCSGEPVTVPAYVKAIVTALQ